MTKCLERRRRRAASVPLTGVLAGAVHCGHPSALLTGGGLFQPVVNDVNQGKFLVVPQHIGIDVIIDAHVLCMIKDIEGINVDISSHIFNNVHNKLQFTYVFCILLQLEMLD